MGPSRGSDLSCNGYDEFAFLRTALNVGLGNQVIKSQVTEGGWVKST